MRVIVTGDRLWSNVGVIYDRLVQLPEGTIIAHGGCTGADTIAGNAAKLLNFPVEVFEAHWETYGSAAGPIRNRTMLQHAHTDLVIAFHNDLSSSRGTQDMLEAADDIGVPTERWTTDGRVLDR